MHDAIRYFPTENFMMNRLQALFNSLVGIQHHEEMLRARARMIFEQPAVSFRGMEVPAYLRRRSRVGIQR